MQPCSSFLLFPSWNLGFGIWNLGLHPWDLELGSSSWNLELGSFFWAPPCGSGCPLLVLAPRISGTVSFPLQSLALRLRLQPSCQSAPRPEYPPNQPKTIHKPTTDKCKLPTKKCNLQTKKCNLTFNKYNPTTKTKRINRFIYSYKSNL